MMWRSKLQQVSVAGSSTLAGAPATYDVATLFCKCSFPGQGDYSCSLRNFFFFWSGFVSLPVRLCPYSIRITMLTNMPGKSYFEESGFLFCESLSNRAAQEFVLKEQDVESATYLCL